MMYFFFMYRLHYINKIIIFVECIEIDDMGGKLVVISGLEVLKK